MTIILFYLLSQFGTQYQDFVNSPRSDSIFIGLVRGNYDITDFADDPVVLWYWHGIAEEPHVTDSLLQEIHMRENFYLSAVLRWEAKEAGSYEDALHKLNLAIHFNPSSIENFFSLIVLSIKYRKFNHLKTLFSLPVFSDFRNQVFIFTNLYILFFLAVTLCGGIYIIVKTIYYLPVLSHRIDPQKHNKIKGIIPFVILLLPILVLRQLYPVFIIYSILLIFIFNSKEKNWLRFFIIILLILTVLPLPIAHYVVFLKHHNRSYQIYEMANYDVDYAIEASNTKEKELIAYALKQQSKLEKALAIYEELYQQGYRNVVVLNNLANIYFLKDSLRLAENMYNQAIQTQDRGLTYFNLGLLKLKTIDVMESSKYMEEARKRKFSSLSKEPIDIIPSNEDYYGLAVSENVTFSRIFNSIYFLPIFIIFILSFLPFGFSPPFYCTTCGRPICGGCLKEIGTEKICNDCFTRFKSTKSVEMEASLRSLVSQGRKRINKLIAYLINIIIPGAGLIYRNRNLSGLIIIFFVMLGYIPLLFPRFFIIPTGWISLTLTPLFLFIAAVIAIFSYIISFSLIRSSYAD